MSFVVQKSATLQLRGEVSEHEGREFVNIREWFKNKEGDYLPSKKGITVPLAHIAEFANGVSYLAVLVAGNRSVGE